MSAKIRHRGPDWSGVYSSASCTLAHERLAIVDPLSGGQPLFSPDRKQVLAVNGEIYNHRDIRKRLDGIYPFATGSDCEVILALYREKGADFLEDISGIFAFALYDETDDSYLIARDPIGVIPLYIGYDEDGTVYVASELKALEGFCERYEPFLPGHCLDSHEGKIRRWYHRDWKDYAAVAPKIVGAAGESVRAEASPAGEASASAVTGPAGEASASAVTGPAGEASASAVTGPAPATASANSAASLTSTTAAPVAGPDSAFKERWKDEIARVRTALEAAVQRQMMSDVPYGVLLSGGLDSSVISAIVAKYSARRIETEGKDHAWWPRLHSFAVGLEGSPDLAKARVVAEHLGTVHHEVHYTIQEGLDALRDVIYHIETYDVTTVRASTPMYLLARFIKSMGIKMVLSGEGADEIFGGYLYFHKAPDAQAFHEETVRKLGKLHLYDCLRANKSLAAWGVEGRVPFLDKEFLDVAMSLDPAVKLCPGQDMEKRIVREAFADLLPASVAWRQKEQFSDGVGYGWIDSLKELTAKAVSDSQMEHAALRFPIHTPMNKEEYYYRCIFEELFPSNSAALSVPSVPSVACSSAEALAWDKAFQGVNDPSGRAVRDVHHDALK